MEIDQIKKTVELPESERSFPGFLCLDNEYTVNSKFEEYINSLEAEGFLTDCFIGGVGQGDFYSHSAIIFWKKGKNHYNKGGFSYVKTCTIYFSHIAPIAIINYSESKWSKAQRRRRGKKVASISSLGYEGDNNISISGLIHDGWEKFDTEIRKQLALPNLWICEKSMLEAIKISKFEYFPGLELKQPSNLMAALFHSGIDWEY